MNNLPLLNAIGDKTIPKESNLSFTKGGSDPDGDSLTYSASSLTSGATFNPATRQFNWTPTFSQAGTYNGVIFTVSDGSLTASESITITVTNTPVATATTVSSSQNPSTFGESVIFTGPVTGSANFNPSSGSSGQRVNVPPVDVASVHPNPQVIEGTEVVLDTTGSTDPNEDEQDSLAFLWKQTSGPPPVELTGANTKIARFTAPRIANPFEGPDSIRLAFELEGTDPSELHDKATVEVKVVSTLTLLDHFFCYKASGASGFAKFIPKEHTRISLLDQFEHKFMNIVKPLGICNPAKKTRLDTGETSEIVDPDTHLEAYQIKDTKKKPAQPKFKKTNEQEWRGGQAR